MGLGTGVSIRSLERLFKLQQCLFIITAFEERIPDVKVQFRRVGSIDERVAVEIKRRIVFSLLVESECFGALIGDRIPNGSTGKG
jgi:hypothetical protein